MGQSINLLILHPHENDFGADRWMYQTAGTPPVNKKCIVWNIEQILNLGYVSAPVKKDDYFEKPARTRAALHFLDCFYTGLQRKIHQEREKCFAPPFMIVKSHQNAEEVTRPKWIKDFTEDVIKGEAFIEPIGYYSIHDLIPSQRVMEDHNGLSDYKPRSILGQHNGYPLAWFPCGEVLDWIRAWQNESHWASYAVRDTDAMAYFNLWSSALEALRPTKAMCLFLFEDVGIISIL